MDNNQLKEKMAKAREKVIASQEKNFKENVGLNGNSICTTWGRENDAFYKGELKIIDYVIKLLEKEENK